MKKTANGFLLLLPLLATCMLTKEALATGALFSRPRGSNQEYNKMWIKSIDVDIDIEEQIAVTHVDQIFFNELNTSVEAIFIFPLPENAVITGLAYWVNGQRYTAEVRERQEAVNAYNQRVRRWLDPALLEYLGDNLFRLSIAPINARTDVRAEITYVEALNFDFGKVDYRFQLNTVGLSSRALETVSVDLSARTNSAFKSFASPTHGNSTATQITKQSDSRYTLFFGDENFFPDKDLLVQYELVRQNVDMNVLTYTPAPADSFGTDGFFALWVTPPDQVEGQDIIPKDIIFTVDISSSMEGERITQTKEAMMQFLNLLNPNDRFNIVTFGTFVEKFRPDLVSANAENLNDAREFVFEMFALGLTNIDEALAASLQQSYGSESSNNMIFLTDGEPTWGETDPATILQNVEANNTSNVHIFSFGVGEDLSRSLLLNIATQNHGFARFIASNDSIALVVSNHFQRIAKPVLQDIKIDLGGLQSWDEYPKALPDLFWGTQVLYLGLYTNSGTFNVTLKGDLSSRSFEYTKPVDFPASQGGHRFVPRLWAITKINHILDLINTHGETQELVNQVIELSLRFQILTPYTAFYVDPDETDPDEPATSVEDDKMTGLPDHFSLAQNYPNPFNPETVIKYNLPVGQAKYLVIIKIYDLLGRVVAVLVDAHQGPGEYRVTWNGLDSQGRQAPSGVYVYEIQAGDFRKSRKMLLLR